MLCWILTLKPSHEDGVFALTNKNTYISSIQIEKVKERKERAVK